MDYSALEAKELEIWAGKPERWCVYINEATGKVTTWRGIVLGEVFYSRSYFGLRGLRMRSVKVRGTNGGIYHGRYGSDWGQPVRLKLCKK